MANENTNNPPTSVDTTDYLGLAKAAFDQSTSYFDAGVRGEIERDLRQFQSLHPTGSKYHSDAYRGRSNFFVPRTRAAIRRNEAIAAQAIFSNNDVVTLEPEDQDDKMQAGGARYIHELLNLRLRKSLPWFQLVCGAYQDAQAVGVCIGHPHWQFNKKKGVDRPAVDLIPIENVRFAPSAKWYDPVNTSPYFIELIPMFAKDVKARTQVNPKTGERKWAPVSDSDLLAAARGYSDSITLTRNQGRQDPNTQPSQITDFTTVWVHRNIIEIDGEDEIYYTLGALRMLTQPRPLEAEFFHGRRPYVVGNCVIETHKQYPSGVSRLTRDTQSELNTLRNQRIDNVSFAMNKRYFVKRDAQVDLRSLQRNMPSSSTLMNDPEKDVKVLETKDVTSSAYQEQDRLNLDFDDLAGAVSQASVQANGKLSDTKYGMETITNDASQIGAYQLKIFAESWMKPVLEQLIELERHYETDVTIMRLAGRKANLVSEHSIDTVDDRVMATPVQVSVHVGVGATTPQVRLTNFIFALKSLREILEGGLLVQNGLDIEETTAEIFSKLGYDTGKRFFDWNVDPQVAALQSQISELQDALKRKDPPEIIAAKVKLLEAQATLAASKGEESKANKVKTGVEATFASMQAAEVVAAVPAVAPVADMIMRAAGYETPTPPGIDPGFAPGDQGPGTGSPIDAAAGLSVEPVTNKRTGIGFTPGGAAQQQVAAQGADGLPPTVQPSTSPMTPKPPAMPASAGTGARHGIETLRPDSETPQ